MRLIVPSKRAVLVLLSVRSGLHMLSQMLQLEREIEIRRDSVSANSHVPCQSRDRAGKLWHLQNMVLSLSSPMTSPQTPNGPQV